MSHASWDLCNTPPATRRASPDLSSLDLCARPLASNTQAVNASLPTPNHTPQNTTPALAHSFSENIPAVSSITIPDYLRAPIPPPRRQHPPSSKDDSNDPPDPHSRHYAQNMGHSQERHLTNQYKLVDPYEADDDDYDMPPGLPYDTSGGVMCFVWEYLRGMQAMAMNWSERSWHVRATT